MSEIDKHVAKAFDSLADIPKRELEATSEALSHRRHPLHGLAGVFRQVGDAREGGWDPSLARFHLAAFIRGADDELLERLEGAEAPFWRHVRAAIQAHPGDRAEPS